MHIGIQGCHDCYGVRRGVISHFEAHSIGYSSCPDIVNWVKKTTAGETMGPGGKATTVITDWVSYQIISNYLTFKLAK